MRWWSRLGWAAWWAVWVLLLALVLVDLGLWAVTGELLMQ